jgi:hypothetical protein
MPKVAQTFKERAVEYAMTATPQEAEDILLTMKQILKSRLKSAAEAPTPARKPKGRPVPAALDYPPQGGARQLDMDDSQISEHLKKRMSGDVAGD